LDKHRKFGAILKGDHEVPPVKTRATGVLSLVLSKDHRKLFYRLDVWNLRKWISAHLHLGEKGVNGPVVAFLFGETIPGVSVDHGWVTGTITSADLIGPLAGKPLSHLIHLIRKGKIYVNAHTERNPNGEIRGQVHPLRKK